ncbi:MAG: hypothetical protein IT381_27020 [Deltaproteobacteria bacterium]|nr:hypothetical protein [Deltaproteobacteria bacterium]
MRLASLSAIVLFACGSAPATSAVTLPFPLTKAQCAMPPATQLKARITIEGVKTPCDLSVAIQANGDVVTTGDCPAIPTSIGSCAGSGATCAAQKTASDCKAQPACLWGAGMTIEWYVQSPSLKQVVTVAEHFGRADLSVSDAPVMEVPLEDVMRSPKTRAEPTETTAAKNRFNCDRSGMNLCDKTGPAPAVTMEADTCSNLEELCNGTLFMDQNDSCR